MRAPLLSIVVALACGGALFAQSDKDKQKFEKERLEVLVEAGGRHLDLGLWCRDRGLTTQAAAEFMYAVEISDGKHYGAKRVLSVMRQYDDAFWKKRKRGTDANRKSYAIRAEKARVKDAKEFLGLAEWAWERGLEAEAIGLYRAQLDAEGDPLEFDDKGRLVLAIGTVPAEASARFREEAVEIDGKLYVRDEFLAALPQIEKIAEVTDDALRIRGAVETEFALELHAMASALMPHLEVAIQGAPSRRLDVFIFGVRENYVAWLDASGLSQHAAASGLADAKTRTAIICAEGKSESEVEALVLHELTHLFWQAVTPTAMPDWFGEGLAETYGGQGTYTWDGLELRVGGLMADHRLVALRSGEGLFSVEALLNARALDLWSADPDRALLFYAQAWAFQRWLRTAAPSETADLFEDWVAMCAGSAAGAKSNRRQSDPSAATELFRKTFTDLGALDAGFREWLKTL